jgi:hypothetical protein
VHFTYFLTYYLQLTWLIYADRFMETGELLPIK